MSEEMAKKIRKHGVEAYPEECCGALLGKTVVDEEGAREVLQVIALENQRKDAARNRFLVAPRDVIRVEKAAKEKGLELIGWYHSHPDSAARPSGYDRENAWPWYSYVIVRVQGGVAEETTSWRLRDDEQEFSEETLEIRD